MRALSATNMGSSNPPRAFMAPRAVRTRCTAGRPGIVGGGSGGGGGGSGSPPTEIPSSTGASLEPADLTFAVSLTDFYHIALKQATEAARSYRSTLDARLVGADVQTAVKLDEYQTDAEATSALKDFFFETLTKHPQPDVRDATLTFMDASMAALDALRDLAKPTEATPLPPAPAAAAVAEYSKLLQAKAVASAAIAPTAKASDGSCSGPTQAPPSAFELRGEGSTVVLIVQPCLPTADQTHTKYLQRTGEAAEAATIQAHFYARVMTLLDTLRVRASAQQQQQPQSNRPGPSAAELFAIGLAAQHIGEGWQQPRLFKPVPLPGWHDKYQSFVFVTDAGPDHIKITVQDKELLKRGIVVHVEHIDRSETDDRSLMEAYRIPSHVTTAQVRLHVGDLAPTSCFIGRPTFEGMGFEMQYPHDSSGNAFGALSQRYWAVEQKAECANFFYQATLLKAAHNTASACTAMFEAGVVDCKIAIENMTEAQAIRFMRAVVANVRRDVDTQVLSAAFNINRPIYSESRGQVVSFRKPGSPAEQLAAQNEFIDLVVNIAAEGHFNKATLDGSSELKGKSIPVVEQLTHRQMLRFTHTAHERQLLTYLSAGLDASNLAAAVNVGIDGMGIGFALHAETKGAVGALSLDKINAVLDARDAAEQSPVAQAARALAFLDYFSGIGALTKDENDLRQGLYAALGQDTVAMIDLTLVCSIMSSLADTLEKLRDIVFKRQDVELAKADALLSRDDRVMAAAWHKQLKQLKQEGDVAGVRGVLRSISAVMAKGTGSVGTGSVADSLPVADATPQTAPDSTKQQAAQLAQLQKQAASATTPGGTGMPASKIITAEQLAGMCRNEVLAKAPGRVFLGTRGLSADVTEADLISRGALVIKPARFLPFKLDRDQLYTAEELLETDENIFKWYKLFDHDSYDQTMMALHDAVILNLLMEQYRNRKQVGIMGGHSMRRDDPFYTEVALLCRDLARNGFVVATGGGPGAMEAANLGAHFANRTEQELKQAIGMLAAAPTFDEPQGPKVAVAVLEKWPEHNELSLGIPTYLYGHEPPNVFCAAQAKFFSNAVREDVLVLTCNSGIVFCPGSAGTRTEIAQFAVPQVYSPETKDEFSKPMIFFGNFWTENTMYQTCLNLAQREQLDAPRPSLHYATKMYQTTSRADILNIVTEFNAKYYPYGDISRGVAPRVEAQPKLNTSMPVPLRAKAAVGTVEGAKKAAAYKAVEDWVNRDGMLIGIGSGKTVEYAVDRLAQLADANRWKDIVCVPTSFASRHLLRKYADVLQVRDMLTEQRDLHVAFDGADATDASLRLIKGSSGALLCEKVVAQAAQYYIVVADWRKDSATLVPVDDDFDLKGGSPGTVSVPVEVKPLAWKRVQRSIKQTLGAVSELKLLVSSVAGTTTPFVTDNGHYILDVQLEPHQLETSRKEGMGCDAVSCTLRALHDIAGVVQVGLLEHATTAAYFGQQDGTVKIRERVVTSEAAMLPAVTAKRQHKALQQVLDAVERHKDDPDLVASNKKPVVEIDLDLCSLMPYRRTLVSLAQAGLEWKIPELQVPLLHESDSSGRLPMLPGYTAAAWNEWLKEPEVAALVARSLKEHPEVIWTADDKNKDTPKGMPGATVHSAFHLRFWACAEEMEHDVVTPGLAEFEDAVQARGGTVVFVSGRWKPNMARATVIALRRARLSNEPNLVIGNKFHDDPNIKMSDADAKKEAQKEVRAKYGLPVAMFDDRKSNLDAVASLAGDMVASDFISVVSCIPGYSAAPTATLNPELPAICNFFLNRIDPRVGAGSTAAAAVSGPTLPAAAQPSRMRVPADTSAGAVPHAAVVSPTVPLTPGGSSARSLQQ